MRPDELISLAHEFANENVEDTCLAAAKEVTEVVEVEENKNEEFGREKEDAGHAGPQGVPRTREQVSHPRPNMSTV